MEYVYAENYPILALKGNQVFFIHTDALGTPRAVYDGSDDGTWYVWGWDYGEPFGSFMPGSTRDTLNQPFTLNLRFPGQYFDAETGLHYNYYRDFDPGTGRYVQSDPIGLAGGLNTYGYAFQTPLHLADPLGLDVIGIHVGVAFPFFPSFEVGIMYDTGTRGVSGLTDLGFFSTIGQRVGGLDRARATLGVSQLLGDRCDFDGTDAELSIGVGAIGGSLGNIEKGGIRPRSVTLRVGPNLGYAAEMTHTTSVTIGDLARAIARWRHGSTGNY